MTIPVYPKGAIVHTVIIAWKPDAVDDRLIADITAELLDIGTQSEGVLDYRIGRDLKLRGDNGDYAVTAIFKDRESFAAYATNDRHLKVVVEDLLPNAERHLASQFEI